jgi:hypothetical protein
VVERLQGRIRFLDCSVEERAGTRCRARVVFGDAQEHTVTGTAERERAEDGEVWCAAEATVDGLREALGLDAEALRLQDVVPFAISDSLAVAVAVRAAVEGQNRQLLGLAQAGDDRPRAAALAVLSATNRFFASG